MRSLPGAARNRRRDRQRPGTPGRQAWAGGRRRRQCWGRAGDAGRYGHHGHSAGWRCRCDAYGDGNFCQQHDADCHRYCPQHQHEHSKPGRAANCSCYLAGRTCCKFFIRIIDRSGSTAGRTTLGDRAHEHGQWCWRRRKRHTTSARSSGGKTTVTVAAIFLHRPREEGGRIGSELTKGIDSQLSTIDAPGCQRALQLTVEPSALVLPSSTRLSSSSY